jgi:hypothetical protein
MNLNDNKISIFDNKFNIKDYCFHVELTDDLLSNTKKLIDMAIKKIPFSLIRPRIMILIPENLHKDYVEEIIKIVYKSGKKEFRKLTFIDERVSIMSIFNELGKCTFLIQLKNGIYGFASCAGQPITKGILFDFNLPVEEMAIRVNKEMPENIPEELKKIKDIDLNSLWNGKRIILSLEPEYYNNKNIQIMNLENTYVSDILYKGLILCAKKVYNKLL